MVKFKSNFCELNKILLSMTYMHKCELLLNIYINFITFCFLMQASVIKMFYLLFI